MTIPPGEGDRTIRSPTSSGRVGGPGDPTIPVRRGTPGSGDPTVPADAGGTGGVPPGGGAAGDGEEPFDRRVGWLLGGVTLAGVLLGALLALLVGSGGGGSPVASTTTSSSTTTSTSTTSTSTTSTTAPARAPQITQFSTNQTNPPCTPTTRIQVTWSTQNAQSVTLTADGVPVAGATSPTGSALVPFSCPPGSHTYRLTARSGTGQFPVSQNLTVTTNVPPPTTTASTTTTT